MMKSRFSLGLVRERACLNGLVGAALELIGKTSDENVSISVSDLNTHRASITANRHLFYGQAPL